MPRTERPRKTKTGTEVAHVTRDSDTTFKGQGHQAALLAAAAAAVTVGTYWPWEPTATLSSAGAVGSVAGGASAPTEERGGGILWRLSHSLLPLPRMVYLCLSDSNFTKTVDWIPLKILPEMCLWIGKSPLNFGSHPDLDPDRRFLKQFYRYGIKAIQ